MQEKEPHKLAEGEYAKGPDGNWYCRPPGCKADYVGNLTKHKVIEHPDGTITVSPSILLKCGNGFQWHGFLEHGIWREC
jgi:hypothetical protein